MIQENRSFDHYFGQMTAYRAANGIPINGSPATIEDESVGSFSNFSPVTGANIAPYHSGSVCTEDLTPAWSETHKNFNWQNPAGANSSSFGREQEQSQQDDGGGGPGGTPNRLLPNGEHVDWLGAVPARDNPA